MPKRLRLTRRMNLAMTEDAFRRLRRLATEAGLDEGEAVTFIFENLDGIVDPEKFGTRIRQFNSELEARKR